MTIDEIKTIKDARLYSGLSQNDAALYLGIPKRNIENWEAEGSNRRRPSNYVEKKVIEDLIKIAKSCKVIIGNDKVQFCVWKDKEYKLDDLYKIDKEYVSMELLEKIHHYMKDGYNVEFEAES